MVPNTAQDPPRSNHWTFHPSFSSSQKHLLRQTRPPRNLLQGWFFTQRLSKSFYLFRHFSASFSVPQLFQFLLHCPLSPVLPPVFFGGTLIYPKALHILPTQTTVKLTCSIYMDLEPQTLVRFPIGTTNQHLLSPLSSHCCSSSCSPCQ